MRVNTEELREFLLATENLWCSDKLILKSGRLTAKGERVVLAIEEATNLCMTAGWRNTRHGS